MPEAPAIIISARNGVTARTYYGTTNANADAKTKYEAAIMVCKIMGIALSSGVPTNPCHIVNVN